MLGRFVHRDEVRADGSPVRDHMHAPFTPILDGQFNFKKMCPRTFYQGLHKDLGDYLEQHLGYRPEIELEDGKRARKALSRVDKRDIDAARAEILAPVERKAGEIVADATERAERASAARKRDEGEARTARKDLADVAGQVDEKRSQAAEIDRQIAGKWPRLTAWTAKSARKSTFGTRSARTCSASSGDWSRFGKRRDGLRRTLSWKPSLPSLTSSATRDALRSAESSMKSLLDAMDSEDELSRSLMASEERLDAEMAIADLARKLRPSARMTTKALKRDLAALEEDMSPRARALEATRAARARDENRDDRPPQRSWGQSR